MLTLSEMYNDFEWACYSLKCRNCPARVKTVVYKEGSLQGSTVCARIVLREANKAAKRLHKFKKSLRELPEVK
jgi:hypothetical protein